MSVGIEEYIPIAIFGVLAVFVGVVPVVLARIVSLHRPYRAKNAPFECGFPAMGSMAWILGDDVFSIYSNCWLCL